MKRKDEKRFIKIRCVTYIYDFFTQDENSAIVYHTDFEQCKSESLEKIINAYC